MDSRAEKLAKARRKLKDHQERKTHRDQNTEIVDEKNELKSKIQCTDNDEPLEFITKLTSDSNKIMDTEFFSDSYDKNSNMNNNDIPEANVNANEYFIFNQKSLENEVKVLQQKYAELDTVYIDEKTNHHKTKQTIVTLESEIKNLGDKLSVISQDSNEKDKIITELTNNNQALRDDNNNLVEQLELTKTILTSKESENAHLYNQMCLYYNQLEAAQLQIQQLTSNTSVNINSNNHKEEIEQLSHKIDGLNKKITILQTEKDNIISHYQHYMTDLREQLNSTTLKNEELSKEVDRLCDRECSLIEQIGEMEIRMQKFNKKDFEIETQEDTSELQKQLITLQNILEESKNQYKELQEQYNISVFKIKELEHIKQSECDQDAISVAKLTADITSDKIAAQRATEQNQKLKTDIEELEQVVVKMTKDKLELTEMLTHEKNLSKELMLKLAEIEETGNNLQKNLKAKDNEMIRLQNEYRELTKKFNDFTENNLKNSLTLEPIDTLQSVEHNSLESQSINSETNNNNSENETESTKIIVDKSFPTMEKCKENINGIPKEDAMFKLQERFMRIMDEVANLSDEKHRLEHIILQLQTETDTICEYVALYQQQRSLLKKRDEERTHQLTMFEKECNDLKDLLGELKELLFRLAEDKEISAYLKTESRLNDMARIRELLEDLQNSSLINKKFKSMDLNSFYPCSCCSGKLIDI